MFIHTVGARYDGWRRGAELGTSVPQIHHRVKEQVPGCEKTAEREVLPSGFSGRKPETLLVRGFYEDWQGLLSEEERVKHRPFIQTRAHVPLDFFISVTYYLDFIFPFNNDLQFLGHVSSKQTWA